MYFLLIYFSLILESSLAAMEARCHNLDDTILNMKTQVIQINSNIYYEFHFIHFIVGVSKRSIKIK